MVLTCFFQHALGLCWIGERGLYVSSGLEETGLFWKGMGTNNTVVWHYSKVIIKIVFFCQHKNKRQYFPNRISSKPPPLSGNMELLVEKQELNLCLEWHFWASILSGLYLHYLFIILNSRLKSTSLCSTWRFLSQ